MKPFCLLFFILLNLGNGFTQNLTKHSSPEEQAIRLDIEAREDNNFNEVLISGAHFYYFTRKGIRVSRIIPPFVLDNINAHLFFSNSKLFSWDSSLIVKGVELQPLPFITHSNSNVYQALILRTENISKSYIPCFNNGFLHSCQKNIFIKQNASNNSLLHLPLFRASASKTESASDKRLIPIVLSQNAMTKEYFAGTFNVSNQFSSYLLPEKGKVNTDGPMQVWDIYYGGDSSDFGWSTATDGLGNVYLAGYTFSQNDIAANGAKTIYSGSIDAFLVKFDAQGNRKWATYFGGHRIDKVYKIAVDDSGNIFITGHTRSEEEISSEQAYQKGFGGKVDAFITKFNQKGELLWSSYFGGNEEDYGWDVDCDRYGNAYITGYTSSSSGIAMGGSLNTKQGEVDGFLAKFSPSGNLLWSTYLGGLGKDYGRAVQINSKEEVVVTGVTYSPEGLPMLLPGSSFAGACDVFLSVYSSNGTLKWSSYFGGKSIDDVRGLTTDQNNNIYLSGYTFSRDGIASSDAYQGEYGGGSSDAYVAKFSPQGKKIWSTYFGGNSKDRAWEIANDQQGNVFIAGGSTSFNKFKQSGTEVSNVGKTDAFLLKFDSQGDKQWTVLYGSENEDFGRSVAVDKTGNIYLSGSINNNAAFLVKYREVQCEDPEAMFSFSVLDNFRLSCNDLSRNVKGHAEYAWDLDSDGQIDYTTKGNIEHTYSSKGTYTIRLIITQGPCQSSFEKVVTIGEEE